MPNEYEKYFRILDLANGASKEDVKKAFRELSLIWHPDNHMGKSSSVQNRANEKFKEISNAYQVLKNYLSEEDSSREAEKKRKAEQDRRDREEKERKQQKENERRKKEEESRRKAEQDKRDREEKEQEYWEEQAKKKHEEEKSKQRNKVSSQDSDFRWGRDFWLWVILSPIFIVSITLSLWIQDWTGDSRDEASLQVAEDEDYKIFFKVNVSFANLRDAPNINTSTILWVLTRGTQVEILEKKGKWTKIRSIPRAKEPSFTGWVASVLLVSEIKVMEDTDQERFTEEHIGEIPESMPWLGSQKQSSSGSDSYSEIVDKLGSLGAKHGIRKLEKQ